MSTAMCFKQSVQIIIARVVVDYCKSLERAAEETESNAAKFLKSQNPTKVPASASLLLVVMMLLKKQILLGKMTLIFNRKKTPKLGLREACPRSIRPKRGSHAMQIATYALSLRQTHLPHLPPSQ